MFVSAPSDTGTDRPTDAPAFVGGAQVVDQAAHRLEHSGSRDAVQSGKRLENTPEWASIES